MTTCRPIRKSSLGPRSEVRLKNRSVWRLLPVKGIFRQVTGNGTVSAAGDVTGTITHDHRGRPVRAYQEQEAGRAPSRAATWSARSWPTGGPNAGAAGGESRSRPGFARRPPDHRVRRAAPRRERAFRVPAFSGSSHRSVGA